MIQIYTDGSLKKGNVGGWAFVALSDGPDGVTELKRESGGARDTTNNQMEMCAVVEALQWAKATYPNEPIQLYVDSAYVLNAFVDDWVGKWQKNNWINSQKKPVKNKPLWMVLIPLVQSLSITWIKIRGHVGIIWNEVCDGLAQAEADKLKQNDCV